MLFFLAALMLAKIAATYSVFNGTFDEGYHLMAGMEMWQNGEYKYRTESPPVASMALAALPYASGVRARWDIPYTEQPLYVLEEAGDYWKTLTLARIGNLIFVPILVAYVYWWSTELYGKIAGLAAVALITHSPNILAHASLATVDFSVTATFVAAAYQLYRWSLQRTLPRLLIAACFVALALMSKYSALGYVCLLVPAYFVLGNWKSFSAAKVRDIRGLGRTLSRGLLFVAVVFALVWGCFGFAVGPLYDYHRVVQNNLDRHLSQGSPFHEVASTLAAEASVPAPGLWDGLAFAADHAREGHPGHFLLGEVKRHDGWWYYFPVVLAVKTPLPFLGMLGLAAWFLLGGNGKAVSASVVTLLRKRGKRNLNSEDQSRDREGAVVTRPRLSPQRLENPFGSRLLCVSRGSFYVALAAGIVLALSMASNLNIGVRHILPIYPFLAILASAPLARAGGKFAAPRGAVLVASLLLAGHVAASAAAHPDYIPYFNETVRGREHEVLGDSNLDWGQDLARLAKYLEKHGIDHIHYYCFGMTRPEAVGITNYDVYDLEGKPKGWLAVSMTALQGIYREPGQPPLDWLWEVEPRAKIGKTIYLYYFE